MYSTRTDVDLLQSLARGDISAFEALFLRHYEPVYRVAYGLVGRRDAAEDLVQDTFLELYNRPPALREQGTLLAWLCRVILNKGHNTLRGEQRAASREATAARVFDPARAASPDPEAEAQRSEEQATVRDALAQLPERQSKLLLLRSAGLSYTEIAGLLGLAPGSIGTLLVRAERAFQEAYRRSEQAGTLYPAVAEGVKR